MPKKRKKMQQKNVSVIFDRKGVADIIIAKQRTGSIGTVSLAWIAQLTKFENLMREQSSPG